MSWKEGILLLKRDLVLVTVPALTIAKGGVKSKPFLYYPLQYPKLRRKNNCKSNVSSFNFKAEAYFYARAK
jgi:hypothetical protein